MILEGPDGSGKTRLCGRLAEAIPQLELQPRVVSKTAEAMVDLKQWVEDDLAKGFGPRLYDRHRLFSEPIYGPVLRGSMEPGFDDPVWLSKQFALLKGVRPVLIYCLPPAHVVRANVIEDDDNEVVWRHIRTIYHLYLMQLARDAATGPYWAFHWNYQDEEADHLFDYIVNHIRMRLRIQTDVSVDG